ncbi:hypothetical protein SNE40_002872 [Patella caerulea]|uniref:Reverse transcriptase domain-containing protein n=1 Tax=Patella caerulea TaxID=87958 RepID=A0AAN8K6S6_PATCE
MDISILDDSYEDILWIKLSSKSCDFKMCLCVCYLPPTGSSRMSDPDLFFLTLSQQIYSYQNQGLLCICGDFNSRIGNNSDFIEGVDDVPSRSCVDSTVNHYGDLLLDFLIDNNMCMLNGRVGAENDFTCISIKGKSVVDYVFVPHEQLSVYTDFKVKTVTDIINEHNLAVPITTPDHSVLQWSMKTPELLLPNINKNEPKRLAKVNSYNVKNFPLNFLQNESTQQMIHETIVRIEDEIFGNQSVNSAYETLVNFLKVEMDNCGLKRTIPSGDTNKSKSVFKPYWDETLQAMRDDMCMKEKAWLRCKHNSAERQLFKREYCDSRRDFDKLHRKYKRRYQLQKQQDLTDKLMNPGFKHTHDFWKAFGKIGTVNDRKLSLPLEVIDDNGTIISDLNDVLNKWKTDYSELYNSEHINFDEQHKQSVKENYKTLFNIDMNNAILNEAITKDEVKDAISRLKRGKAVGFDDIPSEALKNTVCIDMLFNIISYCFENGTVPEHWTTGIIKPIVKANSTHPLVPLTYRGLTLLSVPSKVYCDILNKRLANWTESQNLLVEEQCGFREKRSCLDQLYTLHSVINNRKNVKQSTFACFIDLKKAFDNVDRECLWFQLLKFRVNGKILNALRSLYNNTKCAVNVNNHLTDWFDVTLGVKQGCLLSPSLFAIYINDLAQEIKNLNLGIDIDGFNLSILLYADDIVLLATCEKNLQLMLNCVNEWCYKWRLQINNSKSNILHFRTVNTERSKFEFKCGRETLLYSEKYKYLGLWFDEHLCYKIAVKELAKSASRALGALGNKFFALGGMSFTVFNTLYECLVEPVLLYGAAIWGTSEHSAINNVRTRACKLFLGLPKRSSNVAAYGDVGWITSKTKQALEVFRWWHKLKKSDPDRLVFKVHQWSSRISKSWEKRVLTLAKTFNVSDEIAQAHTNCSSKLFIKSMFTKVFNYDEFVWFSKLWNDRQNVLNGNKLRTYRLFKKDLYPEFYVTCALTRQQRSAIAKLRCGVLPLAIETGRYCKPPIPLIDRICPLCNIEIENEIHFLINCEFLDDIRYKLLNAFNFDDLINSDSMNKFLTIMMSSENIPLIANCILNMLKTRRFYL